MLLPARFLPAFFLASSLLATACAGTNSITESATPVSRAPAPERPVWVNQPPADDGDRLLFTGWSRPSTSEADARNEAFRAALKHLAIYCGVEISDRELLSVRVDNMSETTRYEGRARLRLQAILAGFRAEEWYREQEPVGGAGALRTVVWVRCGISREDVERARSEAQERAMHPRGPVHLHIEGDPDGLALSKISSALSRQEIVLSTSPAKGDAWRLVGRFRYEVTGREDFSQKLVIRAHLVLDLLSPGNDAVALSYEKTVVGLGTREPDAVRNALERIIDTERFAAVIDQVKDAVGIP